MPWILFIIIPLAILAFPLFWVAVSYVISLAAGWQRLAARYTYQGQELPNERSASGRLGLARYRGVLRVGYDSAGLYLGVVAIFRVGHPRLFIPWRDISGIERGKEWRLTTTEIKLAEGPRLKLYGEWAELEGARSAAK
jgi:hypothetical protein